VNPVSAISWLWKALRGHSVTFAVLLAFALLGVSVIRWVQMGLDALGTPWLLGFILPTILIGVLAKKERVWIPEETRRKFWARCIVGGAVAIAAVMAYFRPDPPEPPPNQSGVAAEPVQRPLRPRGPSGK
jgi:biotin transporter BioY